MKKILMILMTAAAMTTMSCGDGNRSNESASDTDAGGDNTELAEPDSTMNQSDTTSTDNMRDRQNDNNRDRDESGSTQRSSDSRNQRDTLR